MFIVGSGFHPRPLLLARPIFAAQYIGGYRGFDFAAQPIGGNNGRGKRRPYNLY